MLLPDAVLEAVAVRLGSACNNGASPKGALGNLALICGRPACELLLGGDARFAGVLCGAWGGAIYAPNLRRLAAQRCWSVADVTAALEGCERGMGMGMGMGMHRLAARLREFAAWVCARDMPQSLPVILRLLADPPLSHPVPADHLLLVCCEHGSEECARWLLRNAVLEDAGGGGYAFALAARSDCGDRSTRVMQLLREAGADPCQALQHAAAWGSLRAVKALLLQLLLERRQLPMTRRQVMAAALRWACARGHLGVVRLLIALAPVRRAPDPEVDRHIADALVCACRGGHTDVAGELLRAYPDASIYDGAISAAASWGRSAVLRLLRHQGHGRRRRRASLPAP